LQPLFEKAFPVLQAAMSSPLFYLNQMAWEIKTHTGIDVAETLLLELPEFM
jgi:hypothetical protein